MNYQWPSTDKNNMIPWYLYLWRAPWFMLFIPLFFLTHLTLICCFGSSRHELIEKHWEFDR